MRAGSARLAALLISATSVLGAACSNTESCRPGTLFVTVELGPYAGAADRLEVDVALEAAGDAAASAPKQNLLALKAGARSGGVEVQFPDGYQTGRTAMITLTLLSGNSPLATQVAAPVLPPVAAASRSTSEPATPASTGAPVLPAEARAAPAGVQRREASVARPQAERAAAERAGAAALRAARPVAAAAQRAARGPAGRVARPANRPVRRTASTTSTTTATARSTVPIRPAGAGSLSVSPSTRRRPPLAS